jgi:hypothetical protein
MINFGLLAVRSTILPGTLRVEVVDSWTTRLQAGASVFTAAALVAGGIWAFFRFRRGRTFKPRCSIDLNCSLAIVNSRMVLTVYASVMNCGDSILKFVPADKGRVEVSLMNVRDWSSVPTARFIKWPEADKLMRQDVFASTGQRPGATELEPGQDMHRSCLFVMPEDWAAAQVRCLLTLGRGKKARNWFSTRVVIRPVPVNSTFAVMPLRCPRPGGWRAFLGVSAGQGELP